MTVFIAHAQADREAAEALGKFLERRGLFVEMETGERGFRHVQFTDTVVALWSKDTLFSPYRLQFEKRTLEAWAEEQLVMVKLDHTFAPVGLRDLKAIDASFDKQRDIAWAAVTKSAQDTMKRPREVAAEDEAPGAPPAPASQSSEGAAPPPRRARGIDIAQPKRSRAVWLIPFFVVMTAIVLGSAYWVWRNGGAILFGLPQPPYDVYLDPAYFVPLLGLAALVLMMLVAVIAMVTGRRKEITLAPHDPDAPVVFVSYAHADNTAVLPVVEAVQAQGRNVWIDKQGLAGGDGWAGEIVRAIKGAKGVIVMCSKHAFESDHVKREVYLADRYKKPMVPIFIEAAAPPEDFEYFFASVQWLELHKTAPADRPAALAKALKAV